MKKLFLFLSFALASSSVSAFDESQLLTYMKLLKAGCSVDADTNLDITADGKLVILKKTKIGGASFELKSSETQNILNALKDDSLKGEQATEQRKCQQHYLDKIFSVLVPENNKQTALELSKSSDGYLFELGECKKNGRNNLSCEFTLTSSFYDRKIRLDPYMYDNFGNHYKASSVSIANFKSKRNYVDATLIADVATTAKVKFANVNTQATGISKLYLIEGVEFRELPIVGM